MKEKKPGNNVVQYTLQSFVGPHITETRITDRQKDAIQRLICLSDEKFEGLCEDIVNEIHNRSGMRHNKDGPMYEKLASLSDNKFRNLVLDTLLVYNYKNPGTEVARIDDFLNNLENLIKDLKSKSESENILEKIKGMRFLNGLLAYNEYIRQTQAIEIELIDEIDQRINSEIKANTTQFVECLSHPDVLLSKLDEGPLKDCPEYQYHRDNIAVMLNYNEDGTERNNLSSSARLAVMKGELQQILMIMLDRCVRPREKTELRYPEVHVVVRSLERIADDLSGRICLNLESMANDLTLVLDQLINEMAKDPNIATESLNQLKVHRVPIEGMANSVTKLDAFRLVTSLAVDLRSILEKKPRCDN